MLKQVLSILRTVVKALAAFGVAAYGFAALVTVVDIIGRKLGFPVQGVVDLVQLFVVTGAWLVMPFAFMTAAHVGVDFVVSSLHRAFVIPLKVMSTAMGLALVGMMLWQGYLTFQTRTMFGDTSQQLGIPIAWYWYPLLVGLTVSLLGLVLELIGSFKWENDNE